MSNNRLQGPNGVVVKCDIGAEDQVIHRKNALEGARFIHDWQAMYSLPGHDIQSLTHVIARSANGTLLAHHFARRSDALRFWLASAMNKSRSVIIPITGHPRLPRSRRRNSIV